MKNSFKYLAIASCLLCYSHHLDAQEKKDWGRLSGSLESNLGFYVNDSKLSSNTSSQENFGTNTFVNLGYEISNFRFGVQYDIYEPPMIGFAKDWEGNKVLQGFASYAASKWDVTLGSFYEQFGSGILFRSYEDRTIGINTAMMGGVFHLRPFDGLTLKGMAGMPRKFMEYAESMVYGVDAEVDLGTVIKPEGDWSLLMGGSWLLRDDNADFEYRTAPQTVRGYSGRVNFSKGFLSLGGEYTQKSENYQMSDAKGHVGRALLLNANMDWSGFGVSMEYRTLSQMMFFADDVLGGSEMVSLNYLPSLTKQHKYALLSLFPHEVEKFGGETGGQIDVFGEIPLGDDDRNPLHVALNGALYKQLTPKEDQEGEYYFWKMDGKLKFAEVGLELEKKWNRDWKSTLVVDWQRKYEFSKLGFDQEYQNQTTVVADILYKITPKNSLRAELQHAWSTSKDDQRWAMGLLEWGLAPAWMFYVSDMYNYQSAGKKVHYFSVGGSYTWKMIRVAAAYGRNREGMQCSGGVCRYVPEYSGLTLNLSVNL